MPLLYIPALFLLLAAGFVSFVFKLQGKKLDTNKPEEAARAKQLRLLRFMILSLALVGAMLLAFVVQPMLGETL